VVQAALNPAGEHKAARFGWTFAPGDKVMQMENDYDKEVYNGDIGYIVDADPEAGEVLATLDGRSVTYGFDTLVPAYAATIHKSQGSEYPAVAVSYETVRRWENHLGPMIATDLRKRRLKPHATWHLDEVYLKIDGRLVYLGGPSTLRARSSMCWSSPSETSFRSSEGSKRTLR